VYLFLLYSNDCVVRLAIIACWVDQQLKLKRYLAKAENTFSHTFHFLQKKSFVELCLREKTGENIFDKSVME
jgi:hypothetical protein